MNKTLEEKVCLSDSIITIFTDLCHYLYVGKTIFRPLSRKNDARRDYHQGDGLKLATDPCDRQTQGQGASQAREIEIRGDKCTSRCY